MTRPTILLAVGCLLAPMAAHAQAPGWDATFFVDPFPSPYLSDWEMNPTMATLTVTNGTGQDADVTVRLSLTDGQGREVIRSRSDPLFIPAGAPETFHTGSALTGTSSYDTAIEDQIARTGRFPEGDYTLCVSVTDGAGFMLVDNRCEFFSTYFPDPPYLLFPMDGDTVDIGDPIFEWTPVQVPVGFDVRYVFQVAELLPGQEPHTALTSGILHFEDVTAFNPSLTYPLGALPLEDGKRYAWWVQALDPNGLPVSSNQGRSEVWTFTHDDEGGDDGGEQIGSSLHGRIVPPGPGVGGPLADLGTADFTSIRDALEELPDEEIPIPLSIGGVGVFDALALSNVSVEVDDVSRTVAISATASLPLGSVNVLLLGQWDGSGGQGSFALALEPLVFDLGEWVAGLEGTPLDEIDWSGGILTIADQARTLDAASLPASVERFYGEPVVELEVGVAFAHVIDLRDTALQDPLARLGLEVDEAELSGTVGLDPTTLFGPVEEREAPELDLTATLRGARLADTPDWLTVQSYSLRVTNEPELLARVELGAEAELGERTFPFTFALDLSEDDDAPAVLTGHMAEPLEGPFGIDWLTLNDVRLTLTPAVEEGEASSAVLRGDLPLGERTVELVGVLEGNGEGMQATFTASLEELSLADFVSFAENVLGGSPFGDGVPADFEAFRDVSLEVRSGDPPMFTALATVPFPGAGTEFMYTLVPTGGGASSFARGLAAVRLSDWALSDMIPALEPTPLGGVPFPGLAMTWTHDLGLPEGGSGGNGGGDDDPDAVDPEPGPTPDGPAWSIHWPDLSGRARDFLAWAYPCLDDPAACPEPTPGPLPPDDPEDPDDPDGPTPGSGGMDWPDIDISGVFSFSDLAGWVRSLIDFQPTPEPGPLPPDPEPGPGDDPARIRGFPGISIADLLDGLPLEPVDLDIDIVLPPIPDGLIGLPDWFRVERRTLRLVDDPEIRMMAEAVVEADLEGPKVFHLSADVTNAEGGGAALEGLMDGAWSQPFGLTWLTLDSVHMAVGAGSVGPRVALGSTLAIGNVDAALALDVRGPAEERSVDFTARAANLSTRDVALFLNDAFDAGLAVPESELTLDSLSVAFSTGEAEAFHLTGGLSAGLDAREAMVALSAMLPGLTVPDELPFELGTLGSTWFDLHVVADSMWGGYGGEVALGEQDAVASLEGSARVEFGAPRPTGDPWVTLEMDVAGRDLVSDDVIDAVAAAVRNDWEIPEQLEAVGTVALDSVRARVAMDTRAATASGELSGAGSFDGEAGALEASVDVGFFVEPEAPWARGTLGLELRDVPMSEALTEAAAALPGEWTIPDALSSMDPLHLDSAALALGFDSRTDSVSASVRGAGTLGEADETRASAELTLVRTPADEWAVGRLAVGLSDASLPEALARAEELLTVEWTLPESVSGLDPVVLDSAALGVAFDSRTATFTSDLGGTAHLGEGTGRMDGALDLALVSTADEAFARGGVTLGVRALDMTAVLDEVRALLPGDWSLPAGFTALDGFYLDEAALTFGFDTRQDSLSAQTVGSGRLGDAGSGFTATTDVTFLRLGDGSEVAGSVTLGRESLTMPEALEQVATLLPGEWALPDGFDAFDDVSLDRADFLLGFDTRTDSVFAAVSGAGGFDGLAADAHLDFLRLTDDDRVSGAMTLDVGSVGAGEALDRIGALLPGEWALPDGFDSFDALTLQSASLTAGFDTGPDSLWAGFEGAGSLDGVAADARLGFQRVRGASGGSGLVTLDLGDVSLGDAFERATSLLPGSWPVPEVDFPIGDLRDVALQLGFDTPADSVWAGVDAGAVLAERDGQATLRALSVGGLAGTPRSWAEGTFRVDVGTVTLPEALELAAGLAPGSPQIPEIDFDLGGIQEATLEAGFRTGDEARTWAGISGGFQMGARTAQAEVELSLGSSMPEGRFRATFDGGFGASDVVELMSGFMPGGGVELPPLGPLDVRLDRPTLTVRFGERRGVSFTGETTLFEKAGDALFSFSRIDGQPQLVLGVQVPDLSFGDLVPEFQNPITDQLNLSLAALTITRGQGTVSSDDLTEEERAFYFPLFGGRGAAGGSGGGGAGDGGEGGGATGGGSGLGDLGSFDVTLTPGLNLTGLVPLEGAGALKDMVDMLAPGASDLTLTGNLPLPGFGGGGIRDLSLQAALPPMAPPGSPAWFVEGEVALQISGRPSVGLAGAMTLDVEGDTLTFDIESNVAVVPAGVELSIAGGLAAANPWVGPLGIDWLTLNEIRLAMGLNPVNVRLGFLGDAVIGSQDIRMALGTRLNLYTGVPMGALVLGETDEGLTLSDLQDFAQRVAGEGAEPLPVTTLPNMALRDLGVRVATYTDFDLGIEAGIGLRGAFLMQTGQGGELSEFGRIELSVDRQGIIGLADIGAWSVGPVAFDDALLDLALTRETQHLIVEGGATIDDAISGDVALSMTRDSLGFTTDFDLFDQFRAHLDARAGFALTSPSFQVRAALYPEFTDALMYDVAGRLIPVGQQSLDAAQVSLDAARQSLDAAEVSLDAAVWLASEASRQAMNVAYSLYRTADNNFRVANSRYRYYAARCNWWSPGLCSARNYWRGIRAARLGQRRIRWTAYSGARAVYENREYLENNPAVAEARASLAEARTAFNALQAEADRYRVLLDDLDEWMDAYDSCPSCARPPMPVQVVSAEAEAALAGFFGRSSVDLTVGYRVFGDRHSFQAGFGGSISDLSQAVFQAVSDALF